MTSNFKKKKKKKKKNYLPTYPIFFWPGERKHTYFFLGLMYACFQNLAQIVLYGTGIDVQEMMFIHMLD